MPSSRKSFDPGIESTSPGFPAFQANSLLLSHQGSPQHQTQAFSDDLSGSSCFCSFLLCKLGSYHSSFQCNPITMLFIQFLKYKSNFLLSQHFCIVHLPCRQHGSVLPSIRLFFFFFLLNVRVLILISRFCRQLPRASFVNC